MSAKFANNREYNKALKIAHNVKKAWIKSAILVFIAGKYTKNKQKKEALELLSEALQIAYTIEDNNIKALRLLNIAIEYNKAGKKNKSLEMLQAILPKIKVHCCQSPGCRIAFLSVDRNIISFTSMRSYKLFTHNKHSTRSTTRVINSSFVRR